MPILPLGRSSNLDVWSADADSGHGQLQVERDHHSVTKVSISGSQDSESFKGSKMNTLRGRKDINLDVSLGLKSKQTLNRA